MQMTIQELRACIAEDVMGKKCRPSYGNVWIIIMDDEGCGIPFRPETDVAQAIEALEAWCDGQEQSAAHNYNPEHREWTVTLYTTVPHAKATHPSLAMAICLAICSAVKGEQVTLKPGLLTACKQPEAER